jgi:argininosuccinate synthase
VRFELTVKALAPDLAVVAPWRTWSFVGRSDLIEYAAARGIPVPVTAEKPYSMDANLMHISYEGGILEDPWAEPPADMFQWTSAPEAAPDIPETVEIGFDNGVPVSIDGTSHGPAELLAMPTRSARATGSAASTSSRTVSSASSRGASTRRRGRRS